MKHISEVLPFVMGDIMKRQKPSPLAAQMLDDAYEGMAAAFLAYRAKHPSRDWEDLLLHWAWTKDLALSDVWAIRRIVRDELVARGSAVFTDLDASA